MRLTTVSFLLIAFVFTSCGTGGKLTKRYKSYTFRSIPEDSAKLWTDINAYIFEVDKPSKPSPKNIFDLSPKGQQELAKIIGGYEKKSDDFLSKLSKNISSSQQESTGFIDYTKFQKRIVISILDKNFFLADRLARFEITFTTKDTNIKITACDKIVTKYETVDIGKQNFSNVTTSQLTGNVGVTSKITGSTGNTTDAAQNNGTGTTAGTGTEATAGYGVSGSIGNTRTFAEEVLLKDRYVAVTGYVTRNTVTLYEESVSGIKLTGNLVADVSFEFDKQKAVKKAYVPGNLFKANQSVLPDSIEMQELFVYYPELTEDIVMSYSFTPLIRHVVKGDATNSEADDKIELFSSTVKGNQDVILLPKEQFEPKLWVIRLNALSLSIKSPVSSNAGIMFFDSYEKAKLFLLWLRKSWDKINDNYLISSAYHMEISDGTKLTKDFIGNAQITYYKN